MKRPNKKHREFVRSILKCEDRDILEHRMMRLPQVVSASIDHGWTCYANFKFSNGKTFYARWYAFDAVKELHECFKDMLEYMRKQRKGTE